MSIPSGGTTATSRRQMSQIPICDLIGRADWFDNLQMRQQVLFALVTCPRQTSIMPPPPPAPEGMEPCPVPSLGRHILIEGHTFTGDGYCWVPEGAQP